VIRVNSTGKLLSEKIRTQLGVMDPEEFDVALSLLEQKWQQSNLMKEMKNLIYRAEKTMESANEGERQQIADLLDKLKAAVVNHDAVTLRKVEEELQDVLIELF
jgi:hypothetical protein